MNTQRVKNLVMILLLALNVVLGALMIDNANRYKMSDQQEKAIRSLLTQNSIGLYAILPTEFRPRKMLMLQPYTFDEGKLTALLFTAEEAAEAQRTAVPEARRVDYALDAIELHVEPGRFWYRNPAGFVPSGSSGRPAAHNNAQSMCDEIVALLATPQIQFAMDSPPIVYAEEGYTVYDYRGRYRGETLYTNSIKFTVSDAGITELRAYFSTPDGFVGEERDIYSCDEALLSLLVGLKSIYGDMTSEVIVLNRIDMVYYLEESSQSSQNVLRAVPYYRIYTRLSPETPFLVNAYNNNLLR